MKKTLTNFVIYRYQDILRKILNITVVIVQIANKSFLQNNQVKISLLNVNYVGNGIVLNANLPIKAILAKSGKMA